MVSSAAETAVAAILITNSQVRPGLNQAMEPRQMCMAWQEARMASGTSQTEGM